MARLPQHQGDYGSEDRGHCLSDYTLNVGYKTGSITFEFKAKTSSYDHGIKLLADVKGLCDPSLLMLIDGGASLKRRTMMQQTSTSPEL